MSRSAAAALALFASSAAWAIPALRTDGTSVEPGGSLRLLGAGLQNYPSELWANPADGLSQALLRLTLEGSVGERWRFQGHLLLQAAATPSPYSSLGIAGPAAQRLRAVRDWSWASERALTGSLGFDRLSVRLRLPRLEVTLGRQAVNFSTAYFWNPLDGFLPFQARAFDRDYKPGVDALRVDLALGEATGVNLVAAAGPTLALFPLGLSFVTDSRPVQATGYGSALVARFFSNLRGFDLSVQAGKVYGGYQAAAGFAGELGGLGVRGEASYLLPQSASPSSLVYPGGEVREVVLVPRQARAVLGVDRRFENGLSLALEYFFNGAVDGDLTAASARLATGEVPNLSRHLAGLLASYPLRPTLKAQWVTLLAPEDPSILLGPSIVYSVSDESELVAGAMLGLGSRPEASALYPALTSEFGSSPNVYFIEAKVYF